MVTITCKKRTGALDKTAGQLRREGYIPYVMYSKGQESQSGVVPQTEMEAILRSLRPGFLPTTQFALKDENGNVQNAIIREIQYEPTTYAVIHLDFMRLIEGVHVDVKVPVEYVNAVDCIGVKLGGFLRSVMRHIEVRCLPENIPSHFDVDVKELGICQSRRVKDIVIPATVTCLADASEVVVSVAKK